jgi:chromosome segregation ATPase
MPQPSIAISEDNADADMQSLNEQNKKVTTLSADKDRLQMQNKELGGRLVKLDELQKEIVELRGSKTELQMQLDKLRVELVNTQEETSQAKNEIEALSTKLKKVEKDMDEMEEENNNLLAKATEHRKTSVALSAALADNAQLTSTVQELQNRAPASGSSSGMEALQTLQKKLRGTEAEKASLEKSMVEWTELAKVSRNLPEYSRGLSIVRQSCDFD